MSDTKKLTQEDVRNFISKEVKTLLEYEQYVDEDGYLYDDEGNKTYVGKGVAPGTYGLRDSPLRGGRGSSRSRYRSPRKTSYVGNTANKEKIAAIQAALESKPNNFLKSILDQLEQGRDLSAKQKGIVKKILKKIDSDSVSLFEGTRPASEPNVDETWMKIINEGK